MYIFHKYFDYARLKQYKLFFNNIALQPRHKYKQTHNPKQYKDDNVVLIRFIAFQYFELEFVSPHNLFVSIRYTKAIINTIPAPV